LLFASHHRYRLTRLIEQDACPPAAAKSRARGVFLLHSDGFAPEAVHNTVR
jgi:hypothetical protein